MYWKDRSLALVSGYYHHHCKGISENLTKVQLKYQQNSIPSVGKWHPDQFVLRHQGSSLQIINVEYCGTGMVKAGKGSNSVRLSSSSRQMDEYKSFTISADDDNIVTDSL